MDADDIKQLSYALSSVRSLRRMQQQELASRSGLSRPFVSQVLNGKRSPDLGSLRRLCLSLNIPITTVMFMVEHRCLKRRDTRLVEIIENSLKDVMP